LAAIGSMLSSIRNCSSSEGSYSFIRPTTVASLIAARERYARINVPVTLVYGDHDWSRPSDRQANIDAVPDARHILLRDTGHFTALEAPHEVARILRGVAP
jgi:pimeloyl-ACP methyl ester carboxylesterase